MEMKKSALFTAMSMALGGISMSAQANLTTSATLEFDAGFVELTGCSGGNFTGTSCTIGGTAYTAFEITDMGGSYFRMDQGGDPASEKVALSMFAPIHLGSAQESSGQHTGTIDGTENPAIDNPWNFFQNTGMHTLSTGVTVLTDQGGGTFQMDFSGWGVNWGNFGPGGTSGTISMPGTATLVCSTASCSASSTYTLDMDVHVPVAFGSVPYSLHLEGHIGEEGTTVIPVPAAAWLFGSGVVGLAGVARRRRSKQG
jgi:hypothetical protein